MAEASPRIYDLLDDDAGEAVRVRFDGEASNEDILATNMIGDADRIREVDQIYRDIGVTDIILITDTGDITTEERRESMKEMASILGVSSSVGAA